MSYLNVTEEAAASCLRLATQLEEEYKSLLDWNLILKRRFEDNADGLGEHAESISDLIDKLDKSLRLSRESKKASLKLQRVAAVITSHIEGSFPAAPAIVQPSGEQSYLSAVLGRMYASGYRQMRKPEKGGSWKGDTFIPDSGAKPEIFNPENRTFGQITDHLKKKFGIEYKGTPFRDGFADFSGIALAQIDMIEIVEAYYPNMFSDMESVDHKEIFSNRTRNFTLANEIMASRQTPIGDLPRPYTANDLGTWMDTNHFTWEESPVLGYLLVPAEIHNNIPHTGLVALETQEEDLGTRLANKAKK